MGNVWSNFLSSCFYNHDLICTTTFTLKQKILTGDCIELRASNLVNMTREDCRKIFSPANLEIHFKHACEQLLDVALEWAVMTWALILEIIVVTYIAVTVSLPLREQCSGLWLIFWVSSYLGFTANASPYLWIPLHMDKQNILTLPWKQSLHRRSNTRETFLGSVI